MAEEETVVTPPAGRQYAGQDHLSDERLLSAQLLGPACGKHAKECAPWRDGPQITVVVYLTLSLELVRETASYPHRRLKAQPVGEARLPLLEAVLPGRCPVRGADLANVAGYRGKFQGPRQEKTDVLQRRGEVRRPVVSEAG